MKKIKTLGIVSAVILVLIIIATAVLAALGILSFETNEEGITEIILTPESSFKNKELEWQLSETEGDKILNIATEKGKIAIKLYDCEATEKFLELLENGAFDEAKFTVLAEDMFIQTEVYGESFSVKQTELACINGAFGFVMDKKDSAPSLFIITAKELSGTSSAFLNQSGFDEERINAYKNFGGMPEYDGKLNVFGMTVSGFDAVSAISSAENSGYTGGFSAAEPISINSITVE